MKLSFSVCRSSNWCHIGWQRINNPTGRFRSGYVAIGKLMLIVTT